MRTVIYFATYLFLLQIVLVPLQSQTPFEDENGVMREMVFSADYKTIQLFREGWTESYPVSKLQGDVFRFDIGWGNANQRPSDAESLHVGQQFIGRDDLPSALRCAEDRSLHVEQLQVHAVLR